MNPGNRSTVRRVTTARRTLGALPRLTCALAVLSAGAGLAAPPAEQSAPPLTFDPSRLGPSDPPAVCSDSRQEDIDRTVGLTFSGLAEYPEALRREELAEFLADSRAPVATRRAVWECAVARWRSFVEALEASRVRQRDEMLRSSRGLFLEETRKPPDSESIRRADARHVSLILRIRSERSLVEERFLLELAECARSTLATASADAAGLPAADEAGSDPMDLLMPLFQRAKVRNAGLDIYCPMHLGWGGVDPRKLLARCGVTDAEWSSAEDVLGPFEAARSSLALLRLRADLGRYNAKGLRPHERFWALERRVRSEVRSAIKGVEGVLADERATKLFLLAARRAYPELEPELKALEVPLTTSLTTSSTTSSTISSTTSSGRSVTTDAPADAAAEAAKKAWRTEAEAAVRAAMAELDETAETGSLIDNPRQERFTEAIAKARAKLAGALSRQPA